MSYDFGGAPAGCRHHTCFSFYTGRAAQTAEREVCGGGFAGCPPQQGASLPRTRCRLMVLASEIGGRWSQETCTFLRLLASHRARQTPQILQQAVSTALLHRWSAMLTHAAAATAYAASLQGSDGASETNVEGTPPSFSELLAQTPPEHPPASRFPPPAT